MGNGASHQTKLEREFGEIGDGEGEERFFGLENFGNTCYCNSVLQARIKSRRQEESRVVGLVATDGFLDN